MVGQSGCSETVVVIRWQSDPALFEAMPPKGVKATIKKLETKLQEVEEAAAKKRFQSGLVAVGKIAAPGSDKDEMYKLYMASPKFSEQRDKILNMFKADKSCKWVTTITREKVFETQAKKSGAEGVCTKCP